MASTKKSKPEATTENKGESKAEKSAGKRMDRMERKITMRSLEIDDKELQKWAIMDPDADPIDLVLVRGFVRASQADSGELGPYYRFFGNFKAKNLLRDDAPEVNAPQMILPAFAESIVANWLAEGQEESAMVPFALIITAEVNKSKKGGIAFQYGVRPALQRASDPFAMLDAEIAESGTLAITAG